MQRCINIVQLYIYFKGVAQRYIIFNYNYIHFKGLRNVTLLLFNYIFILKGL